MAHAKRKTPNTRERGPDPVDSPKLTLRLAAVPAWFTAKLPMAATEIRVSRDLALELFNNSRAAVRDALAVSA